MLLRHAYEQVRAAGWLVGNVDATIHAQKPKIAPHAPAMVANIEADLQLEPGSVNIKGKTNEAIGFVGRQEGIAVTSVALLYRA